VRAGGYLVVEGADMLGPMLAVAGAGVSNAARPRRQGRYCYLRARGDGCCRGGYRPVNARVGRIRTAIAAISRRISRWGQRYHRELIAAAG
jgi:hypothetical protein